MALVALCALLATLLLAVPASADLPTFASSFDGSDSPAGSMAPERLAVNESTGDVYVIDALNDVIDVFSSDGTYESQILGSSTTAGSFGFGGDDDIAIDNSGGADDGNIYVNSENGGLIFAFDSSGAFLWQSSENVSDTCGVAVDPDGNPWMADFGNGLEKLDPSDGSGAGSAILATGDSCHFDFDAAGNIILNHWNDVVDKYDQSGSLLANIDTADSSFDVAVDRTTGLIYVDPGQSIVVFDGSGSSQGQFGVGEFLQSKGVAVNSATATVYVGSLESGNRKVLIYSGTIERTLTVTADGSGDGTVSADSGAISDCSSSGGTCSDRYADGALVTLTAAPASGSQVGWTGCTSATGNQCIVNLTADTNVTATFDLVPRHTLSVSTDGSGSGSVASSPAGISCGATCSALFDEGTEVTLTATPATNASFTGWSGGGCSGTGTCRVTVNADTAVRATFAQVPPAVTTGGVSGVSQTGATVAGSVNPRGSAVSDCHVDYGTSVSYGSSVPCASGPGSGTGAVAVSAALSGLSAGTRYHYRVVATNGGGTTNGADATFTTTSASSPTCETDASLCPSPTPGKLKLAKGVVQASGAVAAVKLSCVGETACKETVRLVVKTKVGKGRHKRVKQVVVARKRVSIDAGKSAVVKLKLSRSARKALARSHRLVTVLSASDYRHRLVVKAPKHKHAKHRSHRS